MTYMQSEKKIKWLTRTGIAMPILFIFYFVYRYGITVPFWDEWEFVPVLEKFHNHTLTLADFWAQHNEHRIFFPKIMMLLMARTFGWNIFLELCVNIILALINLYFLFSLLDATQESKNNPIIKNLFSLLIFSMAQYENWSWGWTIQIYMSMTGIIAAIWAINKLQGQMGGLIVAICAAVFANYSFGAGLLIWPSVLFMLILQKKWKLKHISIWIIAGIVTVVFYYYKHTGSTLDTSILYILHHPVLFAEYVLGYLGSPLALSLSTAIPISLILIIIIILSLLDIKKLNKDRLSKMVPWMAFCIFVFLSACLTAVARVGFGVKQSMSSRYTTISTLFIISSIVFLYNSIILNIKKNKTMSLKDKYFIVIVTSIFFVTYFIDYRHSTKGMIQRSHDVDTARYCIEEPEKASEEDLKILYPNPEIVRQRIKILSELGYKFYKEKK